MDRAKKVTDSRKPSIQGMSDRPEDEKERRLEESRAKEGIECKTVFFSITDVRYRGAKDPLEELISQGWKVECCLGYEEGQTIDAPERWAMAVVSRRLKR